MKKQTTGIFFVCYIAYLFIYVARLNLSMAAPGLKELQILSVEQIGVLGSVFSVVYACGRLLSGILCDRTAPWKMIFVGLALCGISNLYFGLFPPFGAVVLLWSVNALAQSMLWGAILRILSAIYPEHIAKKRASYMATTVAAGNLVGILLNSALISRLGLAWAFLVPGGITLAISIPVVCNTRHIQPQQQVQARQPFLGLLKKSGIRQMMLPALIHGVLKDNISLWMTVYIMDSFGIDLEQSAGYVLLIPMLGFAARLLAPEVYRMAGERERPMLAGGFAVCICVALFLVLPVASVWFAVACLSVIYMAVSMMNACFLSFYPLRFVREGAVASVSGIMDFATYLGTGISSVIFGAMIARYGYSTMFVSWAALCALALYLSRKRNE